MYIWVFLKGYFIFTLFLMHAISLPILWNPPTRQEWNNALMKHEYLQNKFLLTCEMEVKKTFKRGDLRPNTPNHKRHLVAEVVTLSKVNTEDGIRKNLRILPVLNSRPVTLESSVL
jgi:hypothetical protein